VADLSRRSLNGGGWFAGRPSSGRCGPSGRQFSVAPRHGRIWIPRARASSPHIVLHTYTITTTRTRTHTTHTHTHTHTYTHTHRYTHFTHTHARRARARTRYTNTRTRVHACTEIQRRGTCARTRGARARIHARTNARPLSPSVPSDTHTHTHTRTRTHTHARTHTRTHWCASAEPRARARAHASTHAHGAARGRAHHSSVCGHGTRPSVRPSSARVRGRGYEAALSAASVPTPPLAQRRSPMISGTRACGRVALVPLHASARLGASRGWWITVNSDKTSV